MQSILDKIYSEYKTFTSAQQKIAEYLTQHLDEALILNANQLAKEAGVSEATFTRFITRLGFSGFSEFKREVGKFRAIPPRKDWPNPRKLLEFLIPYF
jgi:DNA-binding MurR/RpiR family transcriptional regulator